MSKKKFDLIVISDRSGSMHNIIRETVGGINRVVDDHRDRNVRFTLAIYDDIYEVIADRVPIADVPVYTIDDMQPRGMTAMLDAIGKTLTTMKKRLEGKKRKVIVVIGTDGLENASKEYVYKDHGNGGTYPDYPRIHKMIEELTEKGWHFEFLAANIDEGKMADQIGVSRAHTKGYQATAEGTRHVYAMASMGITELMDDDED